MPAARALLRLPLTAAPARLARGLAAALLVLALALGLADAVRAQAGGPDFTDITVTRGDDGVMLAFTARYELPRGVEDALLKGVPMYFVVEAELFRDRWYWRDRRIGKQTRVWRVAFQPLTRKFRVSQGNANQTHDSLADALASVRHVSGWKIAEAGAIEEGSHHYLELSYRLDTTLLPRPMQIGIGGQPEWTLVIEKQHRLD